MFDNQVKNVFCNDYTSVYNPIILTLILPMCERLTRKIKKELSDKGKQVSRRKIGRIMKQEGLVSTYTTAQFKPQKDKCNEAKVENILDRKFDNQQYRNVVANQIHEGIDTLSNTFW